LELSAWLFLDFWITIDIASLSTNFLNKGAPIQSFLQEQIFSFFKAA